MPEPYKSSIVVEPNYRSISVGDSVEFTCISKRKTIWYHNGGSLPRNIETKVIENKHVLIIPYAFMYNNGNYSCHFVEENMNKKIKIGYSRDTNVAILDVGPTKTYGMYT